MRILFSRLLITVLISTVIFSCKKSDIGPDPASVQTDLKDVPYGNNSAQKMDIYLPAGRSTGQTNVIVFIHGGSWSGGDKSDFNDAINEMRSKMQDFALININYRLAFNGTNTNPAQTEDIQLALDFLQAKASTYIFNPNIIGLVGASAGAHLALLHAYKHNSSKKIKGVVDLFGPTDLTDLYTNNTNPPITQAILFNYMGTSPILNPVAYQQTSPINFVTNQSVPTIIFHGTSDSVVPFSHSTNLKNKLAANNVQSELVTYPLAGHGWVGANLTDTYTKSVDFLKMYIR